MDLFNYIKAQLPVLDVITDYCDLKQMGNYWKGSCPFHNETDASFTVSPHKQIFYCFGCQASGDVVGFMARMENISQFEATQYLIDRYELKVPNEVLKTFKKTAEQIEGEASYYKVCSTVAQWANKQLSQNRAARDYLTNRGITKEIIKKFEIGYFPGGMKQVGYFIQDLAEQGVLAKDLLAANILAEGQRGFYSAFEERILFPIKDHLGRHCGFGGRIFKQRDERAKYYNSKETDWFHKGNLLFGLDLAKKAIQDNDRVFLVEGYTDFVAMVQHGFENTVATLGTACTQDHLKRLSRYAGTLYLLYDGDTAGQKAILRITQLCWEVDLDLKVIVLPAKDDPATFLANNGDLNKLVERASDIVTFFVTRKGEDFFQQALGKKMSIARDILTVIAQCKDPLKSDLLLQQAAQTMQLPFDTLSKQLHALRYNLNKKAAVFANDSSEGIKPIQTSDAHAYEGISLLEEKIFAGILNSVDTNEPFTVEQTLVRYFSSKIRSLLEKLLHLKNEKKQDSDAISLFDTFLAMLAQPDRKWVMKVSLRYDDSLTNDLYEQLVVRFCRNNWKTIIQDLRKQISVARQANDTEMVNVLLEKFLTLKQGFNDRGLL